MNGEATPAIPQEQTTPAPVQQTPFWQWMRENVEAIIFAFIMALIIKCFFIDLYKIPSNSMEPTILGSETNGDRILVTKFYYDINSVERFDVVVFKFPLKQTKNYIKRVVGLPDEELLVHGGDIYTRKNNPNGAFSIARKTLRTQESIWIDPSGGANYLADKETMESFWDSGKAGDPQRASYEIRDKKLFVLASPSGNKSVNFRYEKPVMADSEIFIPDVHISTVFEPLEGDGFFYAEIENRYGSFRVELRRERESELIYKNIDGVETRQNLSCERLRQDRRYQLDLMVFDGSVVVKVNGDIAIKTIDFLTYHDGKGPRLSRTSISFGSENLLFSVQNLRVGRDIYYRGGTYIKEDEPIALPPRQHIMMGDNVRTSHDSREWVKETYRLKDGSVITVDNKEVRLHSDKDHLHNDFFQCDICREYWRKGEKSVPRHYFISGDFQGVNYSFMEESVVASSKERAPFVDESLIIGKAFYIVWPTNRWFRTIR